jgi:hypothetical protein
MNLTRAVPLLTAFGIVAVATAVMLLVRFFIVEPEALAVACAAHSIGWRCSVREIAVLGFLHNAFGWTALLTGAFATIARWRWLGLLAMIAGIAGSVLYTFELSGAGLLLGALVWARRAPMTDEKRRDEQQT